MKEWYATNFAFGPYDGQTKDVELEGGDLPRFVWVEVQEQDLVRLQRYLLETDDSYVFEGSKSFGIKSPFVKKYPNGMTKEEIIAKEEAK